MGTNCAPLLADLFLYSYESEFLDNMIGSGHRKLARSLSLYYRYTDDLIVFNNKKFRDYVKEIYHSPLTAEKANTSDDLANYLDVFPNSLRSDVNTKFDFQLLYIEYESIKMPVLFPCYSYWLARLSYASGTTITHSLDRYGKQWSTATRARTVHHNKVK